MSILKVKNSLLPSFALGLMALGFQSCSLMHDDLDACAVRPAVRTSVNFVYDHNTSPTDLFHEHVGAVTLYVFDSDGKLCGEYERDNLSTGYALASESFKIDLDLQPGIYKLYALAQGHHGTYESSLEGSGAKFRRSGIATGDTSDKMAVSLDHDSGIVRHSGAPIDSIWTTLSPCEFTVPVVNDPAEGDPQQPDITVEATVPLMRITNNLHISFFQEDFPGSINPHNYEVTLTSPKGSHKFDLCGNIADNVMPITYTPYRTYAETGADGTAAVHTLFGVSRIMYGDDTSRHAVLHIRNLTTGHVTDIDITSLLAAGRQAFPQYNWSEQEYLDREYDYNLSICLKDGVWKYAMVNVNILSWTKRIQNTNL